MRFELKISNFDSQTASCKCLSKTILSKKNTFFVILPTLRKVYNMWFRVVGGRV